MNQNLVILHLEVNSTDRNISKAYLEVKKIYRWHSKHGKSSFRQRYPLICILHTFGFNLQDKEEAFSFPEPFSSERVPSRQVT